MDRIKALNGYQKSILVILLVMFIVFTIAYPMVTSRVGYAYNGAILVPQEENESTVYTGRVQGEKLAITVTGEKAVSLCYEEKSYGPYTVKQDATAVPQDSELSQYMTGIEILQGDKVFFRGAVLESGEYLFHEDGSLDLAFSYTGEDGIERDMNGNPIDKLAPSASQILELIDGPELTHKGDWQLWFIGVIASVMTAVLVLFADELFRRKLLYYIENAEEAEPSEWQIFSRYLAWTLLPILALIAYIAGLTVIL